MAANYTHVNGAWPEPPRPQHRTKLWLVRAVSCGSHSRSDGKASPPRSSPASSSSRRAPGGAGLRYGVFYVNPNNTRHLRFGGWKGIVHDRPGRGRAGPGYQNGPPMKTRGPQ